MDNQTQNKKQTQSQLAPQRKARPKDAGTAGAKAAPQTASERMKANRRKRSMIQSYIRLGVALLAIVLAIVSLCVSCSTKRAIKDLAAQIAAKKEAQAQEELLAQQQQEAEEAQAAKGTPLTVSFLGDVTLCSESDADYDGSFEQYYDNNGPTYFFQNVRSTLEGDDLTVANLECTLTTSVTDDDSSLLKADPSYVSILNNSGIDAVDVSNDHVYDGRSTDYDDTGYVDTLSTLDVSGISRFGNDFTTIIDVNGIKIGLCGFDDTDGMLYTNGAMEEISQLRDDGAQIVICCFHWGTEGSSETTDMQISMAHSAVDAGADLVVGHHPGTLQGIELYEGTYIVYSLGSFLYGESSTCDDMDTMIFQATFYIQDGAYSNNMDYEIIPCSISDSTDTNTFCPTLLSGSDADRVMDTVYDLSAKLDGGITRSGTAAGTAENTAAAADTTDGSGAAATDTDGTAAADGTGTGSTDTDTAAAETGQATGTDGTGTDTAATDG